MAGIRSSINLIDNMSNVLNRITGKTNKMKQSIDNAKETMNKRDSFADNLSAAEQKLEIVGQQYARQARKVEELQAKYRRLVEEQGKHGDKTEQMKDKLLKAQLAELKLAESVDKAGKALDKQKNSMDNNSTSANNLMGKIKQLAGYYLGFRGAKKAFDSTIGAAGDMVKQMGVIQAAFGNADVGRNYFNKMRLYAIETRNEIDDLTDVTKNFMQITKNTDKLMNLTDLANRLAMRTGNLGSAESLMQEAMRGEMNRLQRALHLTDEQVKPLENAIRKGSLNGIIKAFDDVLNHAGLDQKMAEAFYNNPKDKFGRALDTMKSQLQSAGEAALMALVPIADKIFSMFNPKNESATSMFNVLSGGLQIIAEIVTWLFDKITNGLIWIKDLIAYLWVFIEPILIAIAIVYLTLIIQKLWAMLPALWAGTQAIFTQAMAWITMHWQILVVIGSITLLIYMLMQTGVTAGQVIGYIIGGIMALGATIFNVVAFAWNLIASFVEFLVNVWDHPHYAMQKLWYDVQAAILDFVIAGSDLLQGFADTAIEIANKVGEAFVNAFNWIINQAQKASFSVPDWVPKIGGKEFKLLGSVEKLSFTPYDNVDVGGWAKSKRGKLKPPTKPAGAWSAPRMNYKNIGAAYNKGQKWGEALPGKFTKGFENIQDSIKNFEDQERKWNAGQKDNLGKLNDKVGKGNKDRNKGNKKKDEIKKAIDKSNEELKWMRDIAEQEVINRFTTATLAPEISIAFGDVRETADVDGIVDHIENILTEQLNIAAEGVHR